MNQARHVRNVNLNLFPILLQVLRYRNVTQAANELHLTQSAVSGSLRRLRDLFGDELLVPRGRELVLTDKARSLLPMLEQMYAAAENLLGKPAFDPASIEGRFRISTADWVSTLLIPALAPRLSAQAPGLSVQFMQGDRSNSRELRQGSAELLIGPEKVSEWTNLTLYDEDSEYAYEVCFTDRLVGIASTQHPFPGLDGDLQSYLDHPHLTFNLGPQIHASMERDVLNAQGLKQRDQFLLPEFSTLAYLVAATGAISVMPLSMARLAVEILPIRLFEPPLPFEPFNLVLVWAKVRHNDEGLRWLRSMIRESFAAAAAQALPEDSPP